MFKSYDLQANAYIMKPMEVDGLTEAVKMLEGF